MQRIHTLIDKLSQQKAQGAAPAQLLFTVQLLHQALAQLQPAEAAPGSSRVAVVLPFSTAVSLAENVLATPPAEAVAVEPPPVEKEIFVLELPEEEDVAQPEAMPQEEAPVDRPEPVLQQKEYMLRKPVIQESLFEAARPEVKEPERPAYAAQPLFNSALEASAVDVPTLAQYGAPADVHERLGDKQASLNDRLKQERTEVAHVLKETPIRDLRKGIGINDRFAFVRELFRGDEAAYERSIKTINNFGIYSEAEYWMSRELKLKLGWNDNSETVKHFYSLVRRRFS